MQNQSKNRIVSVYGVDRCFILFVLAAGLLLTRPATTNGIGFLLPNQDAEAIARGNAFAATADNPSAIYYNPAGITQIQGQDLQLGVLSYLDIDAHYRSTAGGSVDTASEVTPVPEVYYVKTLTNIPVSFGVGLYSPFGLGVQWPQDSGFRSLAIEARLQYITLNPVVAWKILPGLSLAAGPTINYADVKFSRGLISPTDFFEFKGDDFAFGYNVGLLWQPVQRWSFGLTYHSSTTMDFTGHSSYTPAPGGPSLTSKTSASVPFPRIVSGGISFRPTPKWNLEADIDWINWNTLETVTFNGTPLGNLPLVFDWHDSYQFKFGVTRYLEGGWFVSAGYFYSTDTTSSTYFNPAVPDTNLHVGSLGFGHKGEHWHWALAGQIIAGPERTINNGTPADGSYQLFVPTAVFSVGYHF